MFRDVPREAKIIERVRDNFQLAAAVWRAVTLMYY